MKRHDSRKNDEEVVDTFSIVCKVYVYVLGTKSNKIIIFLTNYNIELILETIINL